MTQPLGIETSWAFGLAGLIGILLVAIVVVPRLQSRLISDPKDRLTLENELRKTLAQILGGAAFLIGVYFSWQQFGLAERGQITDRFTRSSEQLGKAENAAVHLGAIYGFDRIARDVPAEAWTVIDVLAGFVRQAVAPNTECKERELGLDVQAALNAIGHIAYEHPEQLDVYRRHSGDLNFNERPLCGLRLVQVNLTRVHLAGAHLDRAVLDEVILDGAEMSNASMEDSSFVRASLTNASLTIAHMSRGHFEQAKFDGAILKGADLSEAVLTGAVFSGADLTDAKLTGAHFEGADLSGIVEGKLTQAQLDTAFTNSATQLPSYLRQSRR